MYFYEKHVVSLFILMPTFHFYDIYPFSKKKMVYPFYVKLDSFWQVNAWLVQIVVKYWESYPDDQMLFLKVSNASYKIILQYFPSTALSLDQLFLSFCFYFLSFFFVSKGIDSVWTELILSLIFEMETKKKLNFLW